MVERPNISLQSKCENVKVVQKSVRSLDVKSHVSNQDVSNQDVNNQDVGCILNTECDTVRVFNSEQARSHVKLF